MRITRTALCGAPRHGLESGPKRAFALARVNFKCRFIEMFGDPVTNPKGWEKLSMDEISEELFAGGDKPPNLSGVADNASPYPVFANGETDNGLQGYTNSFRVSKKAITISARGTLGFCCIREPFFTPTVRLITLVPASNINIVFLMQYMKNVQFSFSGTSQGQLTIPDFKRLSVPVPPLSLQEEFARFVEAVDKSKFAVRQSLEKLKICYKSLMQEYFG